MNALSKRLPTALIGLVSLGLAAGCGARHEEPAEDLLPAYVFNRINDDDLARAVDGLRSWSEEQAGGDRQALYEKVEILPPTPTVQPYGVGVYQQEMRLPVILTTGPGWSKLSPADKEARVADAFREAARRLGELDRKPQLLPTLTVQTPQGFEIAWMNDLDAGGKNVHGDD